MGILEVLNNEKWLDKYEFFKEFRETDYYKLLLETYENLNREILFKSHIHGQSHIERVILFALVLSWKYELDRADTDILRYAASLHDTRRENDGYDTEHGYRAAMESVEYAYDLSDEDKEILKGVMAAHSRNDKFMEKSIKEFDIKDIPRAMKLAKMFKDCDGLDRVRIGDLSTKFLRNGFSHEITDFAQELYDTYK
ncbi:MAG: HD domain-containing protein [Anaerococcus sp.]